MGWLIVFSGVDLYSGGGFIVRGGLVNCILRSGLIFRGGLIVRGGLVNCMLRGWAYSQERAG